MNNTRVDKRLHDIEDEVKLLSGYISDAVGASLENRIGGLAESIESLKGYSMNAVGIEGHSQQDVEAYASMLDKLKNLSGEIGARFNDIEKKIAEIQPAFPDIGDIAGKIPSYAREFEGLRNELKKTGDVIDGKLAGIEKQIEPLRQPDPSIGKLADQMPKQLETLSSMQKEVESILRGMSSLETVLEQTGKSLGDTVESGITRTSGEITQRFEKLAAELKTLGGSIPSLHDQVKSNIASQSQMQKEITGSLDRLKKQFDTVTENLNSHIAEMTRNLSRNGDTLQNMSQRLGQKQDETATKLLKEVTALRENSEVIRRMCSTDEEKFLGGMTTVVYNRTTEMANEMTRIINSMKKWFASLDENQRRAAEKTMDRQDDMKKSLQFDINKVSETLQKVDMQVSHDKRRPIGAEIIRTSDRVAAMEEIVPDIQGKINTVAEQLEQVSKEIRLMRWFVIGAAGMCIAVLAASFFI